MLKLSHHKHRRTPTIENNATDIVDDNAPSQDEAASCAIWHREWPSGAFSHGADRR